MDDSIEINGLPNGLIQSLVNIVNNAIDVLKTIENEDDRYIFIETKRKKDNVTITIRDSGGGIPEDIIDKIFDPYFTTKHKSQGTGLGLHMTYQIIHDHMQGTIEVRNKEFKYKGKSYKGAEFKIVLPKGQK